LVDWLEYIFCQLKKTFIVIKEKEVGGCRLLPVDG